MVKHSKTISLGVYGPEYVENISPRSLKKPCLQRKLRQTKCLLFNFSKIKLPKTPVLPNWTSIVKKIFIFTFALSTRSNFKV